MTKKKSFAYIVLLVFIVLLAWSYLQWKDKISSFQGDASVSSPAETSKQNVENEEDSLDSSETEDEKERLLTLIENQDEEVQDVFIKRFEDEEDLQFLIVGSAAMDEGNPGYAERLENALKKTYGDFIQTTIMPYNGTSNQFIHVDMESSFDFSKGYDVILFEPFTLNNNGIVATEDGHAHINMFREKLTSYVNDAVLILHPPQPVHGATYYPTQVESLKDFAEEENIPYIDHWAEWPDSDSDELLDYVTEDNEPNSEGAEIWANALIHYFIAEKMEEE